MSNQEKEPFLLEDFPPVTNEQWHETILNDLKGADFDKKLIWKTYEGLSIMPFYRQDDLDLLGHLENYPGEPPYLRGNKPNCNHWTIRQDIDHTDPDIANSQARTAMENGVEALGFNAEKIITPAHLEHLLRGIDPVKVQLHFYHAPSYPDLVNFLTEYLDNNNIDKTLVRGSFNYDPLIQLLLTGSFKSNWEAHINETVEFIRTVNHNIPGFKSLAINADVFHNAGSTVVQEIAYGMAAANEYLAALTDKGMSVDEISASLMFTFAVGSDYFPEIAKLRAARSLWGIIVDQYHPEDVSSLKMYVHSSTSTWNKTVFDPYVNMLRTTTETMSAAIAGSDMISVAPFDRTYKQADDFSLRVARNQQIILQQESYLGKMVDPSAGSYYIEKLTDEIARLTWEVFKETEAAGGFINCFKQNRIQDSIEKVSLQKLNDISNRKITVLGVNQYPNLNEGMLDKIILREDGTGKDQPGIKVIKPSRGAGDLELIRLATERHVKLTAQRPEVFLFNTGNLAMRKARATFSSNFFGCAGYHIIDNPGFADISEGIRSCLQVNPSITVICSSDEEYPAIVPAICNGLKSNGYKGILVLAGYPKEIIDQLREAGIDEFIHIRTNLLDSLRHFNQMLGISI
jgi:methylmalonyl-CoA mutase